MDVFSMFAVSNNAKENSAVPAETATIEIEISKTEVEAAEENIKTSTAYTTTPTEVLSSSAEIKMLNVREDNPPPKPLRTFTASQNSLNNLQTVNEQSKITDVNCTPDTVPVSKPSKTKADVNINLNCAEFDTESKKKEMDPLLFKSNAEFIPPPFPTPQTPRANSKVGKLLEPYEEPEFVITAYCAFFQLCFNLCWSIGIACWHCNTNRFGEAVLTISILLISGVMTSVTYFFNPRIPKARMWKDSKIVSALTVVPCLLPVLLAGANIIFAMKESRSQSYRRPWGNMFAVFLVESLSLGFFQCVLQLCILMEDPNSIPSVKGWLIILGIGAMSNGMTFFRIRYDSQVKPQFLGQGVHRFIHYAIIWSHKLLWIVTFSLSIVSFRLWCSTHIIPATLVGIVVILVIYEVPIILSTCERFSGYFSGSGEGLLFILPQFVSLTYLIFWVNLDPNIYNTTIGCFILGVYFYVELLVIMGWLLDSCQERDGNSISSYPHFFGNIASSFHWC